MECPANLPPRDMQNSAMWPGRWQCEHIVRSRSFRLGKQCEWAFSGCTMFHEVAFTVNEVDYLFSGETGVVRHAMDLRLYMF